MWDLVGRRHTEDSDLTLQRRKRHCSRQVLVYQTDPFGCFDVSILNGCHRDENLNVFLPVKWIITKDLIKDRFMSTTLARFCCFAYKNNVLFIFMDCHIIQICKSPILSQTFTIEWRAFRFCTWWRKPSCFGHKF